MNTSVQPPNLSVFRVELAAVESLRKAFLEENKIQFIHNKCHQYNWADTYLFQYGNTTAGYGSVWGKDHREDRDCVFEFYLLPSFRHLANIFFHELSLVAKTLYAECQTNDPLMASLFFENARNIQTEAILFEDHVTTGLHVPETVFYRQDTDSKNPDELGGYVLEYRGQIIARGGLMLNYNFPYADLYMDVLEAHRGKGFGSFIVQELKKAAIEAGRIPAARCNVRNQVSKYTLIKAGFRVCGYLLQGELQTA